MTFFTMPRIRLPHLFALGVSILGVAPSVRPVVGEIIVLSGGGQVSGEVVESPTDENAQYVIRTSLGQVTLAKTQVVEVIHQLPSEIEYEKIKDDYPDTLEGHWELAEWCRENFLSEQREVHLKRILEFDPNHAKARSILGYRQVGDRWVTREDVMKSRGMVRVGGRWISPQEKQLQEERRKQELAEKEWMRKLKRWRDWLESDKAALAAENIRGINDPYACRGLAERIALEPDPRVRSLYLTALANIGTPQANAILVDRSLKDDEEDLRLTALEYLAEDKQPEIVSRYIQALQSKENYVVNRAAVGLENMGHMAAVPALIDALWTTHKYKYDEGQSPDTITSTFDPTGQNPGGAGGGGFTFGGGGPKVVSKTLKNPAVLDALIGLTNKNFDYDQQQWKQWLASRKRTESINARRD